MFAFLWAIIIGFVVGLIAKAIMPGRDPGGFIVTVLLGIGGAVVATWLGQAVGWYQADQRAGFIGAVVGAIIILGVYRLVIGNRRV
ncbi:MAG: GlsB/YeaQ/YmgE family stress response membrane protein [Acetobacteraceae bacterium]|nr:GlsB/YeaQ/YmgE family stress response membrane protein [Acetobacteraceae bacterium]